MILSDHGNEHRWCSLGLFVENLGKDAADLLVALGFARAVVYYIIGTRAFIVKWRLIFLPAVQIRLGPAPLPPQPP